MKKMLLITQREKEGGRGWVSYTTQKAQGFFSILSEIKPQEAHFPEKLYQGGRNGRTERTQIASTTAICI